MFEKIKLFFSNKIVLIAAVVIVGFGSSYLLGNDNPIEEKSEDFIQETINIEIDLSPNSPEVINENR